MLKKTITFVDYNGVERTEDHYFNLTRAELLELETGTTGGLGEMINKIVQAKDVPTIMSTFKTIILKAYGKKSDDGRRFIKSEELATEFTQTEAFSQLYMELINDSDKAAKFINQIVPKEIAEKMNEQAAIAKA